MATKQEIRQALTEAFKAFDLDGSGSINSSELKNVITKFYNDTKKPGKPADIDKQVQEFIQLVDKNKDGKVEQSEFVNFFEDLIAKYN